jgi:hypothetical protein
MQKLNLLLISCVFLSSCAMPQQQNFKIGSSTSKNLFISSDQFLNKTIKVRLRNSSGDPDFNPLHMRTIVENGLTSAGYKISNENAGIVLDINLYFVGNVAAGRQRAGNEVGALLGAVAGYEVSKGSGGIGAGSGAILGAIAGSTLQDVIKANNEINTYLILCDVNIGVVQQESKSRDNFVIGGNRFEHKLEVEKSTFESFALKDTLKISVYAGDKVENKYKVIQAIQDRLARVVSNII